MNHLLYIDPGTGSMLFSVAIGAVAAGYFLLQALWIKLKVAVSGGRAKAVAKNHHPYVIYCEGKQYWNVFKPVLDEFESRAIELHYLTSAEDDPVFETPYQFIKPEYIGEGNKAFARLNFLSADVVLMTTPGLDVYQMKRSKNVRHYAHIMHSAGGVSLYRMFGLDYFDSVLLTGDWTEEQEEIRALERTRSLPAKDLVAVGCPYLDTAAEKVARVPREENHPFTVLVSPTWGKNGLLSRYGEKLLNPLAETGFRIIVRPNPQSLHSESALLDALKQKYADAQTVEWDFERENMDALSKADIMISDFSGIIFDYAFLFDKPVMSVKADFDLGPYDAHFLHNTPAYLRAQNEILVELREKDFPNIGEVITKTASSIELQTARHSVKERMWQHQGEAGKQVADFMLAQAAIAQKDKEKQ